MKKCIKAIFLLSVIFITVSALFGICASAEEGEQISASGYFGDLNWKFSKSTATLTVSGEGRMATPSAYDFWYTYASFVRYIEIGEGAENIAGEIFSYCKMLETVSIPSSVTQIDEDAFYINEYLTVKCNYGSYASSYAEAKGIATEYLDTVDFGMCGENASWILDNNGVLRIFGTGNMDDYKYTSDIPWYSYVGDIRIGIIEDGIENVGQATFYKCSALKEVSLGGDIETVGASAFFNCTSLEEIELPEGVKAINKNAFYQCSSLSKIELPKGVESIGDYAFYKCSSLSEVFFFDTPESIGEYVFSNCTLLESVKLPNTLTALTVGMFEGCKGLRDLDIPASVETIEANAFNGAVFSGTLTLHYGLKDIQSHAFSYCELESLVIPESVERFGGEAFRDSRIKRIYISHDIKNVGIRAFWHAGGQICCWPDSLTVDYAMTDSCSYTFIDPVVNYAQTKISIKYVECVKEILIAKGKRDDYEAIESNLVFRSGTKPLKTGQPFTYTVDEGVVYTVCVVYSDRNIIRTVKTDITKPVFSENGLQLRISNLEGVKLIRVAYGDYDRIGQISRAEGERTFTSKDVLKNRSEYTVQFRSEGLVSVAVCYNNGYIGYYKYNVTRKSPTMTKEGNTVTFTGLEALKVLRYVKGEYDSSYDIKRAEGSVAISGKALACDSLSVRLDPGIYTFCVQYDDESYNYYRVNIA